MGSGKSLEQEKEQVSGNLKSHLWEPAFEESRGRTQTGVHPAGNYSAWSRATAEPDLLYLSKFISEKAIFTDFPQHTPATRPHHHLRMVRHPKPSRLHEAESSRSETSQALLPPSKCSQRREGSQETLRSCGYGCSPAACCTTAAHLTALAPGLSCSTASPTALRAPLLLSLAVAGVQSPVLSKKSAPNILRSNTHCS